MSAEIISLIYNINNQLQSAIKSNDSTLIQSLSNQYKQLIDIITPDASDPVKQLCADYVPRYVHLYTEYTDTAINKQFDLCEDQSTIVRIHAIRGLETIAKNCPPQLTRCIDILVQLLITSDTELAAVKSTLTNLFNIDLLQSFTAIFIQLNTTDDPSIRSNTLQFIHAMLQIKKILIQGNNDIKHIIANGIELYLNNNANMLDESEFDKLFNLYIRYASHKNSDINANTSVGQKIESILIQYVQLETFDITDENSVKRYNTALRYIGQNSQKFHIDNTLLYVFWIESILPIINTTTNELQYLLYKNLATATRNVTQSTARQALQPIYNLLQQYLPSGDKTQPVNNLNFSIIELLLYTFHIAASRSASHELTKSICGLYVPTGQPGESNLTTELQAERTSFINKLSQLQSINNEFISKTNAIINNLQQINTNKSLDKSIKQTNQKQINTARVAVRCSESIHTLIMPLLGKLPSFISTHYLSFQHSQLGKNDNNKKSTDNKTQQSKTQQPQSNKSQKRKSTDDSSKIQSNKRQSIGGKPQQHSNNNKQQPGNRPQFKHKKKSQK